ncbi:MAG: UDP-N-acetylmuramoyl-tripeptide--D-alanyl-D-alanine ligase [Actinomycetota bacterium]|nr:UDP-N-acetylmuramoyl-tripeptide--D-alanyl-D-alanine ligase [Actinomycetota bacterium]
MGRVDPFYGYSVVMRTIVYLIVPLFAIFQTVRLRRALHVFQLEGYKRRRFLEWCKANPGRARFLSPMTAKKPLAMTGRAWRLLVTGVTLTLVAVLVVPGLVHITWGWPYDIPTWALMTALCFFALPGVLLAADLVMSPVQRSINNGYLRSARRKLEEVSPTVVGVTGSFGKTSTKFAIQGLLGPPATVLATPGSFNTPLGVCRTINEKLAPGHRFFVVEMGAYGEGEIAELVEFVRPKIGVLTAIGPAHLERFGSIEAIERGKYEIVRDLPPDGTAVMNVDDQRVRRLADATSHVPVVRYGLSAEARPDVTARDIETTPTGTKFTLVSGDDELSVSMKLLGRHALGHVLAATAVARICGRALTELRGPIAALRPVEHRLQIIGGTSGVTVIDDAYNSNPEGAAAALEVLDAMPGQRKIVVTPGIIELGPLQAEANERFGRHAAEVADTLVVVARTNREAIVTGASSNGGRGEVITVDSLEEAQGKLQKILKPGDVVLFENDLPDQYEG